VGLAKSRGHHQPLSSENEHEYDDGGGDMMMMMMMMMMTAMIRTNFQPTAQYVVLMLLHVSATNRSHFSGS